MVVEPSRYAGSLLKLEAARPRIDIMCSGRLSLMFERVDVAKSGSMSQKRGDPKVSRQISIQERREMRKHREPHAKASRFDSYTV